MKKTVFVVVVFGRKYTYVPDIQVFANIKDADEYVALMKPLELEGGATPFTVSNADGSNPGVVHVTTDWDGSPICGPHGPHGILIREMEVEDYDNEEDE